MNIAINHSNQNNTAFNSKIIVLSPNGFRNVLTKYKNKDFANICYFDVTKNEKAWDSCYKTSVKRAYTKGVRTCTAGVCVNKKEKHADNNHKRNKKF